MAVRSRLIGAAGLLALGLALGGCDSSAPSARTETVLDPSAVAATVNGQPIYVSDVNLEAESQNLVERGGRLEIDSAEFNQVLDELIDVKLLAMEAEVRGLDEDPQARHRLEAVRQNVLGNILVDAVVAERVDEAAIRKMYEAQIAIWELGEEVRVRHILAATKEDIDKVAAELRAGGDFAVVASRRSTDEATRMEGGDLGYMKDGETTPEFARAIRATEAGAVSRPFETELGWHIIKVEERRKERPPSLEELRGPILKHLTMVQIGEVLKELRTSGRIQKLTSPQNSSLDVDPFKLAPEADKSGTGAATPSAPATGPKPEPTAAPAPATPPAFEASAPRPPAANTPAATPPAVQPAPTSPGPVSESREGATP